MQDVLGATQNQLAGALSALAQASAEQAAQQRMVALLHGEIASLTESLGLQSAELAALKGEQGLVPIGGDANGATKPAAAGKGGSRAAEATPPRA